MAKLKAVYVTRINLYKPGSRASVARVMQSEDMHRYARLFQHAETMAELLARSQEILCQLADDDAKVLAAEIQVMLDMVVDSVTPVGLSSEDHA